jgi:TPR repeat protein
MTPRRDNWLSFGGAILAVFVAGILASSMPVNASTLDDARAAFAKEDYAVGVAKFQEAADQGDPEALGLMGTMYFYGIGVPFDGQKAFEFNQKAAAHGRVDAQYLLSLEYQNRRNNDPDKTSREQKTAESLKWLRTSEESAVSKAEAGDPVAQWILGQLYSDRRSFFGGDTGSPSKALGWLTKAAEQNVVSAQFSLGMAYEQGTGAKADSLKAQEWYTKAAEAGHGGAEFRLALILQKAGQREEAKRLYVKAALKGDPMASATLRDQYNVRLGDPTEFDKMQALQRERQVYQTASSIKYAELALAAGILALLIGGGGAPAPSWNPEAERIKDERDRSRAAFTDRLREDIRKEHEKTMERLKW